MSRNRIILVPDGIDHRGAVGKSCIRKGTIL
jgi:hypothetical protein